MQKQQKQIAIVLIIGMSLSLLQRRKCLCKKKHFSSSCANIKPPLIRYSLFSNRLDGKTVNQSILHLKTLLHKNQSIRLNKNVQQRLLLSGAVLQLFSRDGLDRCLGLTIKYVVIALLKKLSLPILPYTLLESTSLMQNVSENAFSWNLVVNFKVYNIIYNPRQNVNKPLTHWLRSYFIDRFEHHETFKM